jgi:hypothetical protein
LGIIGIVFSLIPYLNMLTMLGALVGIVLGVIAVFGSHKVALRLVWGCVYSPWWSARW